MDASAVTEKMVEEDLYKNTTDTGIVLLIGIIVYVNFKRTNLGR